MHFIYVSFSQWLENTQLAFSNSVYSVNAKRSSTNTPPSSETPCESEWHVSTCPGRLPVRGTEEFLYVRTAQRTYGKSTPPSTLGCTYAIGVPGAAAAVVAAGYDAP